MNKTKLSKAADAAKSVASQALGAAAVAATGVVIAKVAGALRKGGQELEESSPRLQRLASDTVAQPLAPDRRKPRRRAKSKQAVKPRGQRQTSKSRRAKR